MTRLAVFDIAAFIWDKNHFENNKPKYYALMQVMPNLYQELTDNNITITIRGKLGEELHTHFPYDKIPSEFYSFQMATLFFLSSIKMLEYPESNDTSVTCTPELVKPYFSATTQQEVRYLITHLHNNKEEKGVLSFEVFWNNSNKLVLHNSNHIEIDSFLCDDLELHSTIILNFKKIFEHNKKHDAYKSSEEEYHGEVISPLSCFNERIDDTKEAQKLLDSSIKYDAGYYNYDEKNHTYVKFVHTDNNIYHGYNVQPSKNDLVNLRKIFHK